MSIVLYKLYYLIFIKNTQPHTKNKNQKKTCESTHQNQLKQNIHNKTLNLIKAITNIIKE